MAANRASTIWSADRSARIASAGAPSPSSPPISSSSWASPALFAPFNVTDDGQPLHQEDRGGAFGQLSWVSADEKLSVELSARYTRDRLHLNYFNNSQSFVDLQPANLLFDDRKSDDDITPRASIRFTPVGNVSLYATVSRAATSRAASTRRPRRSPGAPEKYGKESATNYEAGIKSELLDRKLRANLSGLPPRLERTSRSRRCISTRASRPIPSPRMPRPHG